MIAHDGKVEGLSAGRIVASSRRSMMLSKEHSRTDASSPRVRPRALCGLCRMDKDSGTVAVLRGSLDGNEGHLRHEHQRSPLLVITLFTFMLSPHSRRSRNPRRRVRSIEAMKIAKPVQGSVARAPWAVIVVLCRCFHHSTPGDIRLLVWSR